MTLILSLILKEYRKEYAIYVSVIGGLVILVSCLDTLQNIVGFINKISFSTSYNKELVRITAKNYWNINTCTICCNPMQR